MTHSWPRLLLAALLAACAYGSALAQSRPMTLDDVLSMESFGVASLSPDGDWAVYERRGPYDSSGRYDLGHRSLWAVSDLWIVGTDGEGTAERLLPAETGAGLILGGWSPGGARLLVYRLRGDRLEAGIVRLSDRSVIWTGLTPDIPVAGSAVAWLDDDRLVLTTRPDGSLPWMMQWYGAAQDAASDRWATMAAGREPSATAIETQDGVALADEAAAPLAVRLVAARDGRVRTLYSGAVEDIEGAPDGRWVAIREAGEGVPGPGVGPLVQSGVEQRGRLVIVDTENAILQRPKVTLDVGPHLLRWSPGSDAVLVWARRDGQTWAEGRPTAVRPDGEATAYETGGLAALSQGDTLDELHAVRADWLGRTVILRARPGEAARFDWYVLKASGAPRRLTGGLPDPPGGLASVSDDGFLTFSGGGVWAVGGDGRSERLSDPTAPMSEIVVSDLITPLRLQVNDAPKSDGTLARTSDGQPVRIDGRGIQTWSGGRCPSVANAAIGKDALLSLCRDRGHDTLRLEREAGAMVVDAVNPAVAALVLPTVHPVDHLYRRGQATRSMLFLPAGTPPEGVKGVIVVAYPGSVERGGSFDVTSLAFGPRAILLTSGGYAVLSASIPTAGPDGRTLAAYAENLDLAVDAALAQTPGLPGDRLALLGHSFGGYTVLAVGARSDRYRSVVAWAAPTDLFGKWGEFGPLRRARPDQGVGLGAQMGSVEVGQARAGVPPWGDPVRYVELSPYLTADRIRAPVLLITADQDFVPMSQSERVFTVLHRQGRHSRLLTYWGEGHMNWSPANIRDVYREIFVWLDRTLSEPSAEVGPASVTR